MRDKVKPMMSHWLIAGSCGEKLTGDFMMKARANETSQNIKTTSPNADSGGTRASMRNPPKPISRVSTPADLMTLQRKVQDQQQGSSRKSSGQSNPTGLPSALKSGVEQLSGKSMDGVHVHYNSDKPAQLKALAYTQGTDIHVAPGQESTLPHEAWHVVQQLEGRVKPNMQFKGKVAGNDDAALEAEADDMGAKALAAGHEGTAIADSTVQQSISTTVVQRVLDPDAFERFNMRDFKNILATENASLSNRRSSLAPLFALLGGAYDPSKGADPRSLSNTKVKEVMEWVRDSLAEDKRSKYARSLKWLAQQLGIEWLTPEVKTNWEVGTLEEEMHFAHCTSAAPDVVEELHPDYSSEWVMPKENAIWQWHKFVFSFCVPNINNVMPSLAGARKNNFLRPGGYVYVFKRPQGTQFMSHSGTVGLQGKEVAFPDRVDRSDIVATYSYNGKVLTPV